MAQLPPTNIRFEPELLEWLRERAQVNYRSLTAEVNFLLAGIRDAEVNTSEERTEEGVHYVVK